MSAHVKSFEVDQQFVLSHFIKHSKLGIPWCPGNLDNRPETIARLQICTLARLEWLQGRLSWLPVAHTLVICENFSEKELQRTTLWSTLVTGVSDGNVQSNLFPGLNFFLTQLAPFVSLYHQWPTVMTIPWIVKIQRDAHCVYGLWLTCQYYMIGSVLRLRRPAWTRQ